jgi:hypothetical protein
MEHVKTISELNSGRNIPDGNFVGHECERNNFIISVRKSM